MYYYIVDPPNAKSDQQIVAAIRNKLVPEGIAGEFVYRTPGQSASGLADRALRQGFSTIVAIGDDTLASELASALYDQPAALGVIPMHASDSLHTILGYSDWQTGIHALKMRKLVLRDLGTINSQIGFLTDCVIESAKPTEFYLHMARFAVTITTNQIHLKLSTGIEPFSIPGVINFITMQNSYGGGVFSSLFRQSSTTIDTLLRSEQAVIQSKDASVVKYGNATLATTPVTIACIPQAVRLIVNRKNQV